MLIRCLGARLTKLALLCDNRLVSGALFQIQEGIMVDQLLANIKIAARRLFVGIFAWVALAAFVFAGVSYESGEHLIAIVTTGLLAMALLVVQTMDRNTLRPRTWRLRIPWNTIIVGVAIHYSAIIIGVSFGAVFSVDGNNGWAVVAVLVKQAVLTRAAWILVNEYRQSNSANHRK